MLTYTSQSSHIKRAQDGSLENLPTIDAPDNIGLIMPDPDQKNYVGESTSCELYPQTR